MNNKYVARPPAQSNNQILTRPKFSRIYLSSLPPAPLLSLHCEVSISSKAQGPHDRIRFAHKLAMQEIVSLRLVNFNPTLHQKFPFHFSRNSKLPSSVNHFKTTRIFSKWLRVIKNGWNEWNAWILYLSEVMTPRFEQWCLASWDLGCSGCKWSSVWIWHCKT